MSTTTYSSTNSRPCADCGLKQCPPRCGSLGLLTSILPASAIISQEWTRPETTVPIIDLTPHPADYITMTGLMDAISNGPQSHGPGRGNQPRVPLGPIVCVFVGAVLMAIAAVWFSVVLPLGLWS